MEQIQLLHTQKLYHTLMVFGTELETVVQNYSIEEGHDFWLCSIE